jgi:hypothetical protein
LTPVEWLRALLALAAARGETRKAVIWRDFCCIRQQLPSLETGQKSITSL